MNEASPPPAPRLLVTDFDGTLTRRDFYSLFCERHLPTGIAEIWDAYRAGDISHFEGMRRIFAAAAPGEDQLLDITRAAELEPELPAALACLKAAGWDVVVVSAGCSWYIERILRAAGVDLVVHTNPGRVVDGRLLLELPVDSRFYSQTAGIDKAAVVREGLAAGRTVAYAGDGFLDLEAALLAPPALRFARADLAATLKERGEGFQPFERWRDIATTLANPTTKESTRAAAQAAASLGVAAPPP
jgi:2-hydroxy-3-keto-5-methylthiopentenyl-1-phosphate phosphatase